MAYAACKRREFSSIFPTATSAAADENICHRVNNVNSGDTRREIRFTTEYNKT